VRYSAAYPTGAERRLVQGIVDRGSVKRGRGGVPSPSAAGGGSASPAKPYGKK